MYVTADMYVCIRGCLKEAVRPRPPICMSTENKKEAYFFKKTLVILCLGAEPSQFTWTEETPKRKAPSNREPLPKSAKTDSDVEAEELYIETASLHGDAQATPEAIDNTPPVDPEVDMVQSLLERIGLLEQQVSTYEEKITQLEEENAVLLDRQFSLDKIKDDNAAIMFYTGFPNYETLMSFYHYVEPKLQKMQYWKGEKRLKVNQPYQEKDRNKPGPSRKLSYLDEFLLVLMRMKAGLFVQGLADRFGISTSLVSRICITWINLLYLELNDIFPFPSQELVRKNMPQEFAEYPTTRIILDCSEIFIQRPSAMLAQSETWSEYKHHNTWKVLVGITPNGQVSYLSPLWGGRVSDKQITRESGVLDLLDAGDNVMVDRGFDISNIVPDGVTVNMPPFLAGRDQMTAAETEETMSIASVRIHVERAIGRMKTYHILDGTLPNTLSPYATQIVTVCGLLTNFLPPLLKPANP